MQIEALRRNPGATKVILGVAVLLLVFGTLHSVAPAIQALQLKLVGDAKVVLGAASWWGYVQITPHVVGWLGLLFLTPALILLSTLVVEWWLMGPPRDPWVSMYCIGVALLYIAGFFFINPLVQALVPDRFERPLILVSDSGAPEEIKFIVSFLIYITFLFSYGLIQYWAHRLQHTIPLLWHFHKVHHSIRDMESVRDIAHPLDDLSARVGLIFLGALVGFSYEAVAWIFALDTLRARMLHARAPINFGPFGRWLVDNRYHFTHHSLREKYFDKNFSQVTPLYDVLFGTYVAPDGDKLEKTGLPDLKPATNLWQFLTGRLAQPEAVKEEHRELTPGSPKTAALRRWISTDQSL